MDLRSYQLIVKGGPRPGVVFDLGEAEYIIGRDPANAIAIDDRNISRRHARLVAQGDGYAIEDLGSTNGTRVNEQVISSRTQLRPGDSLLLGDKVLIAFQAKAPDLEKTMVGSPDATMKVSEESLREALAQEKAKKKAEEHHALFTRWFEELWNKKNYTITQELVDENFTAHGAGGQDIKQGPNGVADLVRTWHQAFPDGHMTMDDIITEGDLSVIRMTFTGTHQGDFYGIPASGAKVTVTSIGIDKVINGKITEGWGELNMLGMMQQMGAIPSAPAEAAPTTFEIEAAVTPEYVLEAYGALATGDINKIRQYWDQDMVWQVPGHNELSGWYYNLDEFLAFMGQVGELSGRSFNMEPIAGKVLVTGDYSVDLTRNRGHRAGQPDKTMDIEVAHVLRWRNGKVIAGKGAIFGDGTAEYDQFWSRSPAVTPPTH
jgi:pSer/pThr/pTyr-binding forkhead associated (FHA) protein/ketosteroid isomerase-like protein